MQFRNSPEKYGAVSKTLHWLIALLIITLICVGIYMTDFAEKGPGLFKIFALHKSTGILVLSLATLRVLWHLYSRTPDFVASLKQWEKMAARAVHIYLYLAMFCMPLSGWLLSSAAGRTVRFFGLFDLPNLVAVNKQTQELFATVHEFVGYSLIAVIGMHAAAALKHHFISKDATLRRMLPFCKDVT